MWNWRDVWAEDVRLAIAEKAEIGAAFVRQIKACLYNEKDYCLQAFQSSKV